MILPTPAEGAPMYGIPGIVNFNRQNYKAGTQNWKISQADNGLIYSSNNDGVLEYDGTSWRLLPNREMGLARSVFALGQRVYCGGFNEFGYFEFNGINDLKYTSLMNFNSLGELGDVWNIFNFNDKIVFQADNGIIQYDYRNENILLIPARSRITTAFVVNGLFLLHDEVFGLMELRGNEIYEVTGGDIFAGWGLGTILPLSTNKLLVATGKGDWLYGKVEVRAKVASGRGIWPAIWMLPTDWEYGGWPRSGEIDIMEHVGYEPDSIYTTVHTETFNHIKNTQIGSATYLPDCETDFKVYGIEWDEEKIDFFIDDQKVFTFTNSGKGVDEWPFDQKFHLILNVAVGGNWGGVKGVDNEMFPASMQIDYVRVYQK